MPPHKINCVVSLLADPCKGLPRIWRKRYSAEARLDLEPKCTNERKLKTLAFGRNSLQDWDTQWEVFPSMCSWSLQICSPRGFPESEIYFVPTAFWDLKAVEQKWRNGSTALLTLDTYHATLGFRCLSVKQMCLVNGLLWGLKEIDLRHLAKR